MVIYELLDEMMDWGYPQITDQKILSEYIMQVCWGAQQAHPGASRPGGRAGCARLSTSRRPPRAGRAPHRAARALVGEPQDSGNGEAAAGGHGGRVLAE